MAHPLLHLAAVEQLAREPGALPPPLARALVDDAEYGRFGAFLADLPCFESPLRGLRVPLGLSPGPRSPYSRLFHGPRPIALLLKMAELVSRGALVGRSAGRALLSGYLVHVALDRTLDPITAGLAGQLTRPGVDPRALQRRIEWLQALLHLRERFGREPLGNPELIQWMSVVKRRGMPWAGVGGGIFEILRLSLLEVYGQAPAKGQVDAWVRGLYVCSRILAGPVGRKLGASRTLDRQRPLAYRGPGVDFPSALGRGMEAAREYLGRLDRLLARGDFGNRARGRFLAEVQEGLLASAA